jgi:cysteinyl-tRNA synthetase
LIYTWEELTIPHHENVIAQNFAAFGVNPSKYWLHCRHLMVDGKKMSKSTGNFYTLHDLIYKGFKPMAIKYLLLTMSYRRRLNFTFSGLEESAIKIDRICALIERIKTTNGTDNAEKIVTKARKQFENAMDDNLNTGKALKIMQELAEKVNKIDPDKKSSQKILGSFRIFDSILGLQLFTSA